MNHAAYDMIDRYLRNNLGDDDYAEFSKALDELSFCIDTKPDPEPVAYGVLCPVYDTWEYIAEWPDLCHEHINEMLDAGVNDAAKWVVRPLYLGAKK